MHLPMCVHLFIYPIIYMYKCTNIFDKWLPEVTHEKKAEIWEDDIANP